MSTKAHKKTKEYKELKSKRREKDERKSRDNSVKEEKKDKKKQVNNQEDEGVGWGQERLSLSVDETNKLRAKLGLKPLKIDEKSKKNDDDEEDEGEVKDDDEKKDVHKPAINLNEKKKTEMIREKMVQIKQKRKYEEVFSKTKLLVDEEDEDSVEVWVEKSRQMEVKKNLAKQREKALQEMDLQFGVEEIIKSEFQNEKKKYRSKDLAGLKIEHEEEEFQEGRDVVLTLKDSGVLEEGEGDTLINVNLVDDEKAKQNLENKKKKPDYNPYDDQEFDEVGNFKPKSILNKYDDEIRGGPEKKQLLIGNEGVMPKEKDKKKFLDPNKQHLKLPELKLVTEYYTLEEMEAFKKPTKKIRKIRKKIKLTADALLASVEYDENIKKNKSEEKNEERKIKVEIDEDLIGPDEDLSGIVVEEDQAQLELELALDKARKIKNNKPATSLIIMVNEIKKEAELESHEVVEGKTIMMNSTAEFCRSLGQVPVAYTSQKIKDEENKDDYLKSEDDTGWQSVDMEIGDVRLKEEDAQILDEEPIVDHGLASALKLASKKGYLDSMVSKTNVATRRSKLEAQNYSIEDKRIDDVEDKLSRRRDKYSGSGPIMDFKEKEGYKPDIKLEYVDEMGKEMSKKEAFRYLSHKFHGKGSGKKKQEKRMKKAEEDGVGRSTGVSEPPLNTFALLQDRQKSHKLPYVILSGTKAITSTFSNNE